MMRMAKFVVLIAVFAALAGCAGDPLVRPAWTLKDTDFRKLKPGMTKAQVIEIVGKPEISNTFPHMGEEVWDYSYLDYQLHMRAWVYFNLNGQFTRHYEIYDMWFYGGLDSN